MGGRGSRRRQDAARRSLKTGYRVMPCNREIEPLPSLYRSLTHYLMGDPPVGRSALDMKFKKEIHARWSA